MLTEHLLNQKLLHIESQQGMVTAAVDEATVATAGLAYILI